MIRWYWRITMGLVLIIFSLLSGITNLIALFIMINATDRLQQIYSETNSVMPFWTKNAWFLIVIFLIINILTIFYGRFLLKRPELNKKYIWLSILILIFILFGISLGLKYLTLPILINIYSTINVY